ncbi:MAG: hypothetical protein K2O18_09000 [Oscillospiraceae bacterium]|nr:hypothetical protein [Oscillospiraceae bacterium]
MTSIKAKTGLKIPEIKIPDLIKSDPKPAESPPRPEQMALITTIIERGSGNKLMKLYTDNHVFTHIRSEGTGTATSEILDILGLGSSEKDIVFSLTSNSAARALLDRLDDELRGAVPGRGIAFTMPLTAVNSLLAALVTRSTKKEKEHDMDKEQKSCLIMVLVNQGYTDVVMDTAKKAGARGGTVIRGRWVGEEQAPQLKGLYSQSEKDILFIVVPKDIRNQVMDAVNGSHGVQTKAGALVCSLGIDRLVHLG